MDYSEVLREIVALLQGMGDFLPSTAVTVGVLVALLILLFVRGKIALFLFFVAASYLFVRSFIALSGGDIYSLDLGRVVAGIVVGAILFFIDVYLLVKIISDWSE
ncbi:MAG: hypothetical protein DRG36_03785 [Deltaproteobacteria bacterium]|nr:MAG: hypothetical protein DRG36_03785 [Deltaproteobacteria bacterium]RLA97887.1 MAG: hypothetical protein DRG32_02645 [Deltaproteobacteria bacterium]